MAGKAEKVVCRGRELILMPDTHWHLAHPGYMIFYHNVRNGEGVIASLSLAKQVAGQEDMLNPQVMKAMNDPKEQIWERVREDINPQLPTRIGAFFMSANKVAASMINRRWFGGENRDLVAARAVEHSTIFNADASWLDSSKNEWEAAARKYWSGEATSNPMPEQLLHGAVYFPDWKKPPFGLGGMPSTIA